MYFVCCSRLVYNNQTHTTTNSPGVQTSIPGFGKTDSVDWLDTDHLPDSNFYLTLCHNSEEKKFNHK